MTEQLELNDLNVNNVLNEIRPYIEADGGYLEYVAIDYLDSGNHKNAWCLCWMCYEC